MTKNKYNHTFTIDTKKWKRGAGARRRTLLLHKSGAKCCLGFYLKSLGFNNEEIRYCAEPEDIITPKTVGRIPGWLLKDDFRNSEICDILMQENDEPSVSLKQRQQNIKKLFNKVGVNVKFK